MPLLALITVFLLSPAQAAPDAPPAPPSPTFLSSSAFMLMNVLLPEPPRFYQLNLGHHLTDRDVLLVEAITWTYDAPLGIPWGPDMGDPAYDFPGHVRDVGVGLAYQRFWWRGLYTTAHATPFLQTYHDEDGERIQTGFQLFVVGRLGYRVEAWQRRLFVEPSVACTAWPINTNLPPGFAAQERQWPGYFLAEPGLNIGVRL